MIRLLVKELLLTKNRVTQPVEYIGVVHTAYKRAYQYFRFTVKLENNNFNRII